MKQNNLKRYAVEVVSKETRVFFVNAESAEEAVALVGNIITKTDILPVGQSDDCETEIDITAEARNVSAEPPVSRLQEVVASGSGKTRACKPFSPEQLFSMLAGKNSQEGDENNDGR